MKITSEAVGVVTHGHVIANKCFLFKVSRFKLAVTTESRMATAATSSGQSGPSGRTVATCKI